jgi:hypothetical protein
MASGLQYQRGRDLVPAGEMMFDQEARMIAQRLGLDRHVEIMIRKPPCSNIDTTIVIQFMPWCASRFTPQL